MQRGNVTADRMKGHSSVNLLTLHLESGLPRKLRNSPCFQGFPQSYLYKISHEARLNHASDGHPHYESKRAKSAAREASAGNLSPVAAKDELLDVIGDRFVQALETHVHVRIARPFRNHAWQSQRLHQRIPKMNLDDAARARTGRLS